ncbi:MFS transporter [Streptomyces ficellus]|uniref:MFS transporter n=1 Tax=Streptomyces ficellus TaxID=1977088 RepID=A0ABT7Z1M5_9ACTN|nr:MFS transporter [Streptomyces ficellus]MDN3293403.1 MFS transporter [Streptomyces ficellus]
MLLTPARIWFGAGLILLAVNLRAAITSTAPLLGQLAAAYQLSPTGISVLTTLPILCLGAFAAAAPALAARTSTDTTVTLALAVLTAGILLRTIPHPTALYTGTVVAGAGIAIGNVLLPAVIKQRFPNRVGPLTGLAMMLMAASGAAAAALAVPLHQATGWRIALAVWALPSLAAVLLWGPLAARNRTRRLTSPTATPQPATRPLTSSPLAWAVSVFLGLVSLVFYALTAWLPEVMQARGHSPAEAGAMLSGMLLIGIPLGLAVPIAATRMPHQRPLVTAVAATKTIALAGICFGPPLDWLWVLLLGAATGSAFPLAMTLLSLRAPDPATAARLSGMAQAFGYLLAGCGPFLFGLLHSSTGMWAVPLLAICALVVPETLAGMAAARPLHIRLRPPPRHATRARRAARR